MRPPRTSLCRLDRSPLIFRDARTSAERSVVRSALRHAEFRRYWAGSMALYVGYWLAFFFLGWLVVPLAIEDGHPERAPLYVGLMGLASAVPVLSLTLVAGTIADRADLRRILIATQSALAILSLAPATLTLTGVVSIAHVLPVAALPSAVPAFGQPPRQSVPARLVARDGPRKALWPCT